MTTQIVLCAEARAWLAAQPAAHFDALVSDPPAGIGFMGKTWDRAGILGVSGGVAMPATTAARNPSCRACGGRKRAGAATKGCACAAPDWNDVEYRLRDRAAFVGFLTAIFVEARRVLKPGAHALVWAIPRTSHWTATALEDAGFEIRDVVTHLFGQGFPKSLNVAKAIDRELGAEREVIGHVGGVGNVVDRTALDMGGATGKAKNGLRDGYDLTATATAAAKEWEGWGTALKPASEHWILARVPLIGTVAANVVQHGTGALNIDGCRIETADNLNGGGYASERSDRHDGDESWRLKNGSGAAFKQPTGRWPANVTLDEDAAALLDKQSDASRFFYVAKAPVLEKSAGLDERNSHPTVKSLALMRWLIRLITPPGGKILDPFAGSGTTLCAAALENVDAVGIEQSPEYVKIAEARIAHWRQSTGLLARADDPLPPRDAIDLPPLDDYALPPLDEVAP